MSDPLYDALAALLSRQSGVYDATDRLLDGQTMFLTGRIDDPDSFDINGSKAGPLGYYPMVDASGVTRYTPCLARLALGGGKLVTTEW